MLIPIKHFLHDQVHKRLLLEKEEEDWVQKQKKDFVHIHDRKSGVEKRKAQQVSVSR